MVRKIMYKNDLLAIHITNNFVLEPGINFLTDINNEFQLGFIKRNMGYKVAPHKHIERNRQITKTSEFLFIKSGKCLIRIASIDGFVSEEIICVSGDVVLLLNGIHGIDFLEDTELIEVKQGPYISEFDKEIL